MSESEKSIVINKSGLSADKRIMYYTPYVTSDKTEDNLKEYPSISADSNYAVPAR